MFVITKPEHHRVLNVIIVCALTVIIMMLFHDNNKLLFFALTGLLLILHHLNPGLSVIFYLICGLGGAISEAIIIKVTGGTWRYRDPDIAGIPLWLVPLWGIAGGGIVIVNQGIETVLWTDT